MISVIIIGVILIGIVIIINLFFAMSAKNSYNKVIDIDKDVTSNLLYWKNEGAKYADTFALKDLPKLVRNIELMEVGNNWFQRTSCKNDERIKLITKDEFKAFAAGCKIHAEEIMFDINNRV